MENKIEGWQLAQRQGLPLEAKIILSKQRIQNWIAQTKGNVYISFSGGKDSTVLLNLVREVRSDVIGVFCDTGLEYPEIIEFVKKQDNIVIIKPTMNFKKVIEYYGYPVISKEVSQKVYEARTTKSEKLRNKRLFGDSKGYGKIPKKWVHLVNADFTISHQCCNVMKKRPFKKFEKESGLYPIVGTMAKDSSLRKTNYLRHGCNSWETKRPMSAPISFWTEEDIWNYIKKEKLSYSKIYDKGYHNTGCMFCMFGVHLEGNTHKFIHMKKTHPKQYEYCMDKIGCRKILEYINVPLEG